jgi:hypothetical protein
MAIFNRIAAIKTRLGFDDSLPLAIVPASLDLVKDRVDAKALVAAIKRASAMFGRPVGKITIDTVSRTLAGADENSPEGMGALIRNVDAIRAATGAHACLIHHSTKEGTSGKGGRGHSSLWGAIDTEIDVIRGASKVSTATVGKQRNGTEGLNVSFTLETVPLGTDADGDTVSSCIVALSDEQGRPATIKLSPACQIALDALRRATADSGTAVPSSRHVKNGTIGVKVDLWRDYAFGANISDGKPDARRMAFKRAAEQLQARGIVGCWQEFAWICKT